jgi:hypothetical protein
MLYVRSSLPAIHDGLQPTASMSRPASSQIAEPAMRYRRRGSALKPTPSSTAPSDEIERRVRARNDGARWRRIMALNARISAALTGELRTTWLSLEESLHDHWLDVALEHYRVGFEAGTARAFASHIGSGSGDLRSRLQALAAALAQLIAELEERDESR